MKTANQSIQVMGPSAANVWYWWHQHELELFLKFCDKNTDAVSLHWYGSGTTYSDIVSFAQSWYSNWNYIHSVTGKPVYITEWNNHGSDGNINTTFGNAIVNADVIGAFARTGVAGHCFFGCIHGATNGGSGAWGILYGNGESKPLDTPTPSYYVFPIWTKMGTQVLSVASTADSLKVLGAYAHKRNDGSVQVMLINKSAQTTVDINLTGVDPTGHHAKIYELKPVTDTLSTDVIYNGTVDPNPSGAADLPAPWDSICKGPTTTRTLPAFSITMIDFQSVLISKIISKSSSHPHYREGIDAITQLPARSGNSAARIATCGNGTLRMYTPSGRLVKMVHVSAEGASTLWQPSAPGVYLVKFINEYSDDAAMFLSK